MALVNTGFHDRHYIIHVFPVYIKQSITTYFSFNDNSDKSDLTGVLSGVGVVARYRFFCVEL